MYLHLQATLLQSYRPTSSALASLSSPPTSPCSTHSSLSLSSVSTCITTSLRQGYLSTAGKVAVELSLPVQSLYGMPCHPPSSASHLTGNGCQVSKCLSSGTSVLSNGTGPLTLCNMYAHLPTHCCILPYTSCSAYPFLWI